MHPKAEQSFDDLAGKALLVLLVGSLVTFCLAWLVTTHLDQRTHPLKPAAQITYYTGPAPGRLMLSGGAWTDSAGARALGLIQ